MTDGYGDRERGLVSQELREASWSDNELILPLAEALRAVEAYREAGCRWVAAERLSGWPGRQIGGDVDLGTGPGVWGWSDDYVIEDFPDAIRDMDSLYRSVPTNADRCLLFCLMIMDEDHADVDENPTREALQEIWTLHETRLLNLVEAMGSRLPAEAAAGVREFVAVNEFGVAFDGLVQTIAEAEVVATGSELALIDALANHLDESGSWSRMRPSVLDRAGGRAGTVSESPETISEQADHDGRS